MGQLKLLDCTLRDGGYINNWMFGENNIQAILHGLFSARIDIIECGYLSKKRFFQKDSTQICDVGYLNSIFADHSGASDFVAMINYGEFPLSNIPEREAHGLTGLRVAFHKNDRADALSYCKELRKKGYDVYIQPMVALSYGDEEFIELIHDSNDISPKAFYIVDSFGAMKKQDLLHALYLTDYNLNRDIAIGFHSHNNLQLSYSLAQMLCEQCMRRDLVIDSSIYGMGRGAGNLNTELFAEYLNQFYGASYNVEALLRIIDNVIAPIYHKKYWGYSLPLYLSATHNCHPNYAIYLDDKNTLTVENIHEIFSMMEPARKAMFDRDYIRDLYIRYQSNNHPIMDNSQLRTHIMGREVLVLAPGKSSHTEVEKIRAAAVGKIVISINYVPKNIPVDYVFVSNLRRWDNIDKSAIPQAILTSNIRFSTAGAYIVDYASLLNEVDAVKDNAGMMLISLLIQWKAKEIFLAGMDGYATDGSNEKNFVEPDMEFNKQQSVMDAMNRGMETMLRQFMKQVPITIVTTPQMVHP